MTNAIPCAAFLRQNDLGQVQWVFLGPTLKGTPSVYRENMISAPKNQVFYRSNIQIFSSNKGVLI